MTIGLASRMAEKAGREAKTDTAIEIPNFETTDINRWSTECSESVIYAYLTYLREHMVWLETEGKRLLERQDPLSPSEYALFMTHLGLLLGDIPNLKPLKALLKIVIRKGIASLKTLAESGQIDGEEAHSYMKLIDFHLQPAATFGVVAYDCSESEELIDAMIPIAQTCKSERMLERVVSNRFPGRKRGEIRELFGKLFKNW
ncbi:MAG: hypothetical protein Q7R93_00500 [bacterium]|nr:hypothetical protein [bacterium]